MNDDLEMLRNKISNVDAQILKLVADRIQLVKYIRLNKQSRGLPAVDLRVEKEVLSRAKILSEKYDLNEEFSRKIINLFIQEAIRVQVGSPKNRASYLYEVLETVKKLESQGEKIIKLEVGEPDLSSPLEVKKAALTSLYNTHIGYGSSLGIPELRKAIAQKLSEQYRTTITENQVLITPGGKFAIFAAIFSKLSLGDRVVIPEPFWPVYDNCSRLAGGRVDFIHTLFDDNWQINLDKLAEALDLSPKLLILCSPSNPTGKIIPKAKYREICQLAENQGTCILSDEVYSAYAFKPSPSILELTDSNYIYVNSFSKKFGMTGWRIGYAVSDIETISRMQKLVQISVTCVPEFIQRAALQALTMNQDLFHSFAQEMKERITLTSKELNKYSDFSYTMPDGGMYLFPKGNQETFNSTKFAKRLLLEKKVSIAPGEAFGDYPKHFRISLGINKTKLLEGIQRIGEVMKGWREK